MKEKRSGSIEEALTAPVNETSIVLGKFLAAWVFFLDRAVAVLLFLISLRIFGNALFEYGRCSSRSAIAWRLHR